MKKVAVVGTVGLPACYGGFESLVENLTKYNNKDIDYQVFCSSKTYQDKLKSYNGANLIYLPLNANGIQSIPYDILSLLKCLWLKPDVTLILGVSGCIFLPFYKMFSNSRVVTNIDGLEWKRDKWGRVAKWFLKFSEKLAVKYSDVIITDNQAIGDYVVEEYGKECSTIAYGGDHVFPEQPIGEVEVGDYYLGLCRIEPENNVSMILEAFSQTKEKLKFIGNWDSSDHGKALKEKFQELYNIDIIDPVYDIEKLFEYRMGCIGYVHGHSAGGTNPSLVEAMHFNKPIYAYDCDFNRFSTEGEANYFSNASDLVDVIENSTFSGNEVVAKKMSEIAQRRYTWAVISEQYENCYQFHLT